MNPAPRSASRSRGVFFIASISLLMATAIAIVFGSQTGSSPDRDRARAQLKTAVASGNETELQRVEANHPGSEEAALARMLRGYMRLQAQDHNAAASLLGDAAVSRQTLIGDYALFYRARALSGAGRAEEAERDWLRLAQSHPSSLLAREARRQAASSAASRGAHQTALDYIHPLAASDDGPGLKIKADVLEKLGRTDESAKALRRLHFYAPQSSESANVGAQLSRLGSSIAAETAAELTARGNRLYEAGQFVLAAQSYDLLARQFPAATTNETWLRAGISNYQISSHTNAIDALSRVRAQTPKDQIEALFYTGLAQIGQKRPDLALVTLANLRQAAPGNPRIAELLYELARSAERASQTAQAASYYEQVVKQFPRDSRADEAHFFLAWRAHEAKAYRQSSDMLLEHVAEYASETDNRGKAAFWAALDSERAGEKSRALTLYRALLRRYSAGWYGVNADRHIALLERSGIKPMNAESGSVLARAIAGLQNITTTPESVSEVDQQNLAKSEQLMRLALHEQAMEELQSVRSRTPNGPRVNLRIAQVFRAQNENAAAINALRRAYPDYGQALPEEMTREVWEVFYPLGWWTTIQQEARRHNIDPYMVAGLIRQETIFNPQARSRANALGLMQILPSTGRMVGRKYSLNGGSITSADLFNPILSIQLGTAYLSDMIRTFGRFEYAAAAYNGGPNRVARWLNELPTAEIEEWVDSIPLSETRGYVQGVYRNARQYQRLYDEHGRFRSNVPER